MYRHYINKFIYQSIYLSWLVDGPARPPHNGCCCRLLGVLCIYAIIRPTYSHTNLKNCDSIQKVSKDTATVPMLTTSKWTLAESFPLCSVDTDSMPMSDEKQADKHLPAYNQQCSLEHSNSQFESIRFVMRIDSFCKKNRPFDSLVVMQFFLLIYIV